MSCGTYILPEKEIKCNPNLNYVNHMKYQDYMDNLIYKIWIGKRYPRKLKKELKKVASKIYQTDKRNFRFRKSGEFYFDINRCLK